MAEDRRIRHTQERITDAMITCLGRVSLDKITVKEICDIADINRCTFYAHYADPFALYESIERAAVENLSKHITNLKTNKITYKQFLMEMVTYVDKNDKLYLAFIRTNSASFKAVNLEFISKSEFGFLSETTPESKYASEYLISGVLSVFTKWLQGDKKEPPEFIADILYRLTVGGDRIM